MPPRRADVALAELERLALNVQVDAGVVPAWARRPLLPQEERARVDFPAITVIYDRAYTAAEGIITALNRDLLADLRDVIPPDADARDTSAAVTRWALRLTPAAAEARLRAVTALAGVLENVAGEGAELLQREAATQGLVLAAARNTRRARARNLIGRFEDDAGLAVEVAATKVQQVLVGAGQAADRGQTLQAVENVSQAAALDSARQAAHVAHGEGRKDAADDLPPPKEIYASELLDEATCGPCEGIDGRQYNTLAEGEADYPGQGPYRDCKGGARCRGMLVLVYDE